MTRKNKYPAIQWYVGDWRKDPLVQSLDMYARGVWHEMLMIMFELPNRGKWTFDGSNPIPDDQGARLLGLEVAKFKQTVQQIVSIGVASVEQSSEIIFCRRMVKDEELRTVRAEAGSIGGKQSASKRLANAKQNPTPSSSFASSSSIAKTLKTPLPPKANQPKMASKRTAKAEADPPPGFVRFWEFYRTKFRPDGKAEALKIWLRDSLETRADEIMLNLEWRSKDESWTKDDGKFAPHARTYLSQKRYQDPIPDSVLKMIEFEKTLNKKRTRNPDEQPLF